MDRKIKTLTYIFITQSGEDYEVRNRFMADNIIGVIKWNPFANEYCYYMNENYWHKEKVLSTTNMRDILRFIRGLDKPEDVRFASK